MLTLKGLIEREDQKQFESEIMQMELLDLDEVLAVLYVTLTTYHSPLVFDSLLRKNKQFA